VHALPRDHALSAHDIFKDQYPRTLRWSVLGALLLLVLAVLVMPEYVPTPYRLEQEVFEVIELEPIAPPVEEEPPPREIRRPVNVEPVPDDDPAAEVPPDLPIYDVPYANPLWTEPTSETEFVVMSEKPRLLRGAVADYPEIARLAGMQGTVVVKVLVDIDGSVARTEILKGVHPLLDRPALAAASKLRFRPGTQRGNPVACHVAVPFRFFLR
jgi:protein TonB